MKYTITISLSRADSDIEISARMTDFTRDELLAPDFFLPGMDTMVPLVDDGITQQANIDFGKAVVTEMKGKSDVN